MAHYLSAFTLFFLMVGSIDNIRNVPSVAFFGYSGLFFMAMAALFFLIPCTLVAAELASRFHQKNGIHAWIRAVFGENWAFFAVWLQFINTLVWFPTMLAFIAGNTVYMIHPTGVNNKSYTLATMLIVFWGNTWLSRKGIKKLAYFINISAVLGMIVPLFTLIVAGWYWKLQHISSPITPFWPTSITLNHFTVITAIMTSFLGLELAASHIQDLPSPRKLFPRVLMFASVAILLTMGLASLSLAYLVPHEDISFITGVMQAFVLCFGNQSWLLPILLALMVVGNVGGLINWMTSPLLGLLTCKDFLPSWLQSFPRLLLMQSIMTSLISAVFVFMPTMNRAYWFLSALSTELYLLLYVGMFIAFLVLKRLPPSSSYYQVPGGQWGAKVIAGLGLIGCSVSIALGFIPPDKTTTLGYGLLFLSGLLVLSSPAFYLIFMRPSPLKHRALSALD